MITGTLRRRRGGILAVCALLALPSGLESVAAATQRNTSDASSPVDPVPPNVFSRDTEGRTTVRAVRLDQPLRVDGRLDEAVYQAIPAISDFIQSLPKENAAPTVEAGRNCELLLRPFVAARNVTIAPGGYTFSDAQVQYSFGQQRRASGVVSLQRGNFYNGTITAVGYSGARVAVTKQSVEPGISINRGAA